MVHQFLPKNFQESVQLWDFLATFVTVKKNSFSGINFSSYEGIKSLTNQAVPDIQK